MALSHIPSLDLSGVDPKLTDESLTRAESIVSAICSLSPPDRARFALFGIGHRQTAYFNCIHDAFAFHSASQPDAIAVEHLGQVISFRDLDRFSAALAHSLVTRGVLPGTRVCLLVRRSISMVIGILGILRAGASYIPLDGGIVTDSALSTVLHDSGTHLVLTLREIAHRVPGNFESLCLDTFVACNKAQHDVHAPCPSPFFRMSHHEAYVIYTSGTTGRPKGVSVSHGNVLNLVTLPPGRLGMRPGARVSQLMNIAFDMCAWEVLGSLVNGCTLCIRGKTKADWNSVLKTVDIVIATPTILQCYKPADYPNIKCIATAGEPCPQSLADSWSTVTKFYNSCGPTEVTIVNTMRLHKHGEPVSIGSPIPNNRVYILDDHLKPVPIGEVGMMWASGSGLSAGYINLPEITAERFVEDPFVGDGTLMFRTGDLGRWSMRGQLYHLGRVDDQVKVKGFRIELDGVAAAMETSPGVKQAVALLIASELWGFVSPDHINMQLIHDATSSVLPYYAVPCKYVSFDKLPITSNNKVDKAALKSLAERSSLGQTGDGLSSWQNEKEKKKSRSLPASTSSD